VEESRDSVDVGAGNSTSVCGDVEHSMEVADTALDQDGLKRGETVPLIHGRSMESDTGEVRTVETVERRAWQIRPSS
jgi:hypothetical protein